MKTILAAAFLSLFFPFILSAEENSLPQSANWLIDCDAQALNQSRLGKFLLAKASENPKLSQKMQGLKSAFGLDLEKIRRLSAFGSGERQSGTAFLSGGINAFQLEGFAALSEKVEIKEHGDRKIYSLKKGSFHALAQDSLAVASKERLLLDALNERKQKSTDRVHPLTSFVRTLGGGDSPLLVFAADLSEVSRFQDKLKPEQKAILQKFKRLALILDEEGDDLRIRVHLQAADQEVANHLEKVTRGWPSLLALFHGASADLDEALANLSFSVNRKDRTVSMTALIAHAFLERKVEEKIAGKATQGKITQ